MNPVASSTENLSAKSSYMQGLYCTSPLDGREITNKRGLAFSEGKLYEERIFTDLKQIFYGK